MTSENQCDKDKTLPTNEEVVEELTKDLSEQHINESPTISTPDDLPSDSQSNIPEDFDKSDDEEEKLDIPTDYIDEDALKVINESLTEEEKNERRTQAAELKATGNKSHKNNEFVEAIDSYTQALRLCPLENQNERSVLYSNRAASKIQLNNKKSALDDCSKAVELNPNYVRAYLRRAKLHEELDKLDESLEDYKKVLDFDAGNPDALKATVRLPPLINERNEKLKTEMLGKLKDLGNLFLRPFGLSTDNFNLQQNSEGGGYSVNFSQNK